MHFNYDIIRWDERFGNRVKYLSTPTQYSFLNSSYHFVTALTFNLYYFYLKDFIRLSTFKRLVSGLRWEFIKRRFLEKTNENTLSPRKKEKRKQDFDHEKWKENKVFLFFF